MTGFGYASVLVSIVVGLQTVLDETPAFSAIQTIG
jgi:hypothetical protein